MTTPPLTVADLLRARMDQVDRQLDIAQAQALDLLDAQRSAWLEAHPYRLAAAVHEPSRELPELRLLLMARWSHSLREAFEAQVGSSPMIFMQGYNDHLYLRIVARRAPEVVHLYLSGIAAGRAASPHRFEKLPAGIRRFALAALNGGPGFGSLWYLPAVSAEQVLGVNGSRMELHISMDGPGSCRPMGEIVVPPLQAGPRIGHEEPEARSAEETLRAAIRAYSRQDKAAFTEAITWLSHKGHGARELRRWQVLWLRAMLAELRARQPQAWQRSWAPTTQGHAQLQLDP